MYPQLRIPDLFIVLVQMHFMQREQFSETNVTSHTLQQISQMQIFPECFWGSLKMLQPAGL